MKSASSSDAAARGSIVPMVLLTVVAVALGAGATLLIGDRIRQHSERESAEQAKQRLLFMTGMDRPVTNKLDPRYTDADGDLLADCPADVSKCVDPKKIVFSYVAQEDTSEYQKDWQPFLDYLSKKTGKPVEYLPVKTAEEELKALRDGALHVAAFNSGSVPWAVNACGFVPVCRVPTGVPGGTRVVIIVPSNSSLQNVQDLRGHELTLTDANSNTGYKAPMVLLRADYGLEPETDYKIRTSNGHEASILGVANKTYEAAAVAGDMLVRLEANQQVSNSQYRTIFVSETFPSAAIGYAHNLKPELAAKIREAITTFDIRGTALEREFVPAEQSTFVPVTYRTDWSLIRRIDDACGRTHELN
ncbi:MAG: phosphate/phosphite/phosphonate ABC transporter substrate-binding protein [Tepidisphaeraceae bacterium]